MLEYIKDRISLTAYELWIKTIKFHGISNGRAILTFKSDVAERMVFEQYTALIQDAFLSVTGDNILIWWMLNLYFIYITIRQVFEYIPLKVNIRILWKESESMLRLYCDDEGPIYVDADADEESVPQKGPIVKK